METPRTTASRILEVLGTMSATTGILGVALAIWGQLLGARRRAFHVDNGHPMTDGIILLAPMPGFVASVLAVGLGMACFRAGTRGTAWGTAVLPSGPSVSS